MKRKTLSSLRVDKTEMLLSLEHMLMMISNNEPAANYNLYIKTLLKKYVEIEYSLTFCFYFIGIGVGISTTLAEVMMLYKKKMHR